jgi:hypothetical protein
MKRAAFWLGSGGYGHGFSANFCFFIFYFFIYFLTFELFAILVKKKL